MSTSDTDNGSRQATREALIGAGMRLFGRQGFDGTSIRQIAAEAGTNSASIAYHFGSKDGLRLACAEAIAERLSLTVLPVIEQAGAEPGPETALKTIEATAGAMAQFILTHPQAEDLAPFILREVREAGEVLDHVYGRIFEPVHRRACRLWATATGGEPESEETRIEVFALIGQILYFRIAREIVVRRLGWEAITPKEAARISDVVASNIRAIAAAKRSERS